jgi:hypothetical protein
MAIRSAHSVFAKVEQSLATNRGAIPALLADPEGKAKVYALLDRLGAASVSLASVAHQLETGNGAIPLLVRDERFGREFTQNLRDFSHRLDSIGRKLDEGQGTAGRLINDPAIFDAANDIIVGIDESKLLRWLIRNRQKSGIRKRYDAARRSAPETDDGDVAPPPPTPLPTATPGARPDTR